MADTPTNPPKDQTPPTPPATPEPQVAPPPFDPMKDMQALASGTDVDFDVPDIEMPPPEHLDLDSNTPSEDEASRPSASEPPKKEPDDTPPAKPGPPPESETGTEAPAKDPNAPEGDRGPGEDEIEQPFVPTETKHPKARQLREAYEGLQAKHKTLEDEVTRLRTELETRPVSDDSLAPKLQSLQEERDQLRQQLTAVAFERSPEYKQRFIEPFKKKITAAYKAATAYQVTDPKTEEQRQGTVEDFEALRSLPEAQAARLAEQMFGAVAGATMIWHLREVNDAREAAESALANANKTVEESNQEALAQQAVAKENFRKIDSEIVKKYPAYFTAAPEETEKAQLINRQLQLYDAISNNPRALPPEQFTKVVALFRRQISAFPWLVKERNKHLAEIDRLQKELDEYAASEPSGGVPGSADTRTAAQDPREANFIPDAHAEIDELAGL